MCRDIPLERYILVPRTGEVNLTDHVSAATSGGQLNCLHWGYGRMRENGVESLVDELEVVQEGTDQRGDPTLRKPQCLPALLGTGISKMRSWSWER